ncbi:MAG: hypothetical protein Q8S36_02125 [Sulfuricurvum sp.]|nr:hypothetical protein [Sulfuricurvum sp.]
MQRYGYTRASLAIALLVAAGLGYIAYLQYRLAQVDSVIATTISGAHKAAKSATKLKSEGSEVIELSKVAEMEKKGWKLSDNNQSYEYKEDGQVHATMSLDHVTGKVVYKIDCGSFKTDEAQQECSDVLDGTGKNYVATDEVPW